MNGNKCFWIWCGEFKFYLCWLNKIVVRIFLKFVFVFEFVLFLIDWVYLDFNVFVLEKIFIGYYVFLGELFLYRIYN